MQFIPGVTVQPVYTEMKPFETGRYSVTQRGVFYSYVSRYYYDHRAHWYMWNDSGVKAEVKTLTQGVNIWIREYVPGVGFRSAQ